MLSSRACLTSGALMAGLSVLLGAFAAHALKLRLTPEMLAIFKTGSEYQFFHALGLVLLGVLQERRPADRVLAGAAMLMLLGVLLFSGSLYALALTGLRPLGIITPFGGIAFLAAWSLAAWSLWRR